MCFFQRRLPLVLSTHQRYRLLSDSATLRKMRLPQMIGVAPVLLGMESRQTTFSVVLQRTGRSFSPLVPLRFGPRHCGQFSASIGKAIASVPSARDRRRRTPASLGRDHITPGQAIRDRFERDTRGLRGLRYSERKAERSGDRMAAAVAASEAMIPVARTAARRTAIEARGNRNH